jgi:hypothetical protein
VQELKQMVSSSHGQHKIFNQTAWWTAHECLLYLVLCGEGSGRGAQPARWISSAACCACSECYGCHQRSVCMHNMHMLLLVQLYCSSIYSSALPSHVQSQMRSVFLVG